MAGISETCSMCGTGFEVQFRYQMEERDGGFSFFCSQKCLEKSQIGSESGSMATCDACAKRFTPALVSQVLYVSGKRRYACGLECRGQLIREANGVRLGEIAAGAQESSTARRREGLGHEDEGGEGHDHSLEEPADAAFFSVTPPSSVGGAMAGAPRSNSGEVTVPIAGGAPRATPASNALLSGEARRPSGSPQTSPPATPATAVGQASRSKASDPQGRQAGAVAVPVVPQGTSKRGAAAGPVSAPVSQAVPRYLAVFNHKGGTGKTTTAVSVAAGLANKGKKVLLVDTDAQGNVSVSLGANAERSLYHVLVMGLRVADATKTVRPNLDLLPSNETLAAAELYLAGRQNRDRVLADRLGAAAVGYDYVVLDCSPSLSLMNQNALVFADSVLVPVACDYLSLVGVRQVIKTVKNVNALLHHPVQIWGVLPTFFDGRAKIAREAVSTLQQHFGERCLPPIRQAIKVKEAPAQGQTIFEYASGTSAADDYLTVVERIIESREKGQAGSEAASARAAGATRGTSGGRTGAAVAGA